MSRSWLLNLIFVIGCLVSVNAISSPADGLVAHYKFEGNTVDSSGNNNHGVGYGGVTYTSGAIGKAVSLDGLDDYVGASLSDLEHFSISLWFRIDSLPNQWNNVFAFEPPADGFMFYFLNNDPVLWIERHNDGGESISPLSLQSGTFHHLAVTNDSSFLRIYINGKLEKVLPRFDMEFSDLRIGAEFGSGIGRTGYFLDGAIDEFRVYNRSLTEGEILQLYKEPDDHGNSGTNATRIGVDSRTAGLINYPEDNDFFRVQVGTAGTLTLYTTGSTDTYGYLLNAQGGELARNDDASPINKNFRIQRSVPAGTYFVRARHALASGTGAYTLAAEFTAADGKAQRAVLLLHGMNSAPDTWNKLVTERWSGKCETIYAGVVTPIAALPRDSLGAACYRLKFGRYDKTGYTGLEKRRCPTTEPAGCKGDFTAINASGGDDLGVEVFAAVRAILWRLGSDTQVTLLGHSRGGLAARAFVQRPATSAERSAVVGLVTTGTPHRGSPLGRIYAYLKTYCLDGNGGRVHSGNPAGKPRAVWSACEDDWEAVDDLAFSTLMGADLYLGKPTIGFLAPASGQIQALNAAGSLANLPSGLSVVQLRYAGQYLGHLGTGYSAWDRLVPQGFDQFSLRSRDYALCGRVTIPGSCADDEDSPAFNGDGIVPRDWQGIPGLAGVPGLAAKVLITKTRPNYSGIYHKDETKQFVNIDEALEYVEAWQ